MKKNGVNIFWTFSLVFLIFIISALSPAWAKGPDWPNSMSWLAGRTGTSVYVMATGFSSITTKYVGIKTVPEAGSGAKNMYLMHQKQAEFGLAATDEAYNAARGLDEFKKYGKMNVRLMFSSWAPVPFAFVTRRDANIHNVKDLKGKNVLCIYPPSPRFTRGADMLFEAAGITRNDVNAIPFSGHQEGDTALKENRASAYIHVQTVTSVIPFIQQLNTEVPIRLVGVSQGELDAALPKYPYFVKAV
ncbi:MAG: TAXI family TRAP transporter solute-binding subunit, partial [Desulfobacterales bacterium]|nr:TAXI family TRAP transporter solute-binding subunit [Desulfobacterales bacterium]